jgi:cell division FtsZ-interacting protein ZapD
MSLAKTKLAVYRQIAIDLLKLNKKQVKKDYSKKYMQEQRTKYDNLIENMSINKNYINKIDQKWNVKTKNAN